MTQIDESTSSPEKETDVERLPIISFVLRGDASQADYTALRQFPPDRVFLLRETLIQIGAVDDNYASPALLDSHIEIAEEYLVRHLQKGDPFGNLDRSALDALVVASSPYHDAPIYHVLTELRLQFNSVGKRAHAHAAFEAEVLANVVVLQEHGL